MLVKRDLESLNSTENGCHGSVRSEKGSNSRFGDENGTIVDKGVCLQLRMGAKASVLANKIKSKRESRPKRPLFVIVDVYDVRDELCV
jgi:hypothetical protein